MDVMGWSSVTMKQKYMHVTMHVTETIQRDVANQFNDYFRKDK